MDEKWVGGKAPTFKLAQGETGIMQQFNQTIDDDEKIQLLNNYLTSNGFNSMPVYSSALGEQNRTNFIGNLNLDPNVYQGVMLPTPQAPPTPPFFCNACP